MQKFLWFPSSQVLFWTQHSFHCRIPYFLHPNLLLALPVPTPLETRAASLPACMSQEQATAEPLNSRVQPHFQEPCGDKAACGASSPRVLLTEHLYICRGVLWYTMVQLPWLYAGDVLYCCVFLHTHFGYMKTQIAEQIPSTEKGILLRKGTFCTPPKTFF